MESAKTAKVKKGEEEEEEYTPVHEAKQDGSGGRCLVR